MSTPAIVWFRNDLRLADNPAFHSACETGKSLLCLYIYDDNDQAERPLGGASRWWLHHSLSALSADIEKLGGSLVILRGDTTILLGEVMTKTGASDLFWNRVYDPRTVARDSDLKTNLGGTSFNSNLLFDPHLVKTKSGTPFQVFTRFWKHCQTLPPPPPPIETSSTAGFADYESLTLSELDLLPTKPDWAAGLRETWTPGEAGARQALAYFLASKLKSYKGGRDFPARDVTSRLSPHLRFGEISPRQIWHAAQAAPTGSTDKFLAEVGWREFSWHLRYHFGRLENQSLKSQYDRIIWNDDPQGLEAWQKGLTGYPIVDAGMRELWHTGYMHNRVRMIAASFLIKDLLVDWREGETWFWDTLVDADAANNPASWQWVAGCGADAAPYFRIFNPVLQGEKFDPDGTYVRKWIPELARVEDKFIHKPWLSPVPPKAYPAPIVDHAEARKITLERYSVVKAQDPEG